MPDICRFILCIFFFFYKDSKESLLMFWAAENDLKISVSNASRVILKAIIEFEVSSWGPRCLILKTYIVGYSNNVACHDAAFQAMKPL